MHKEDNGPLYKPQTNQVSDQWLPTQTLHKQAQHLICTVAM